LPTGKIIVADQMVLKGLVGRDLDLATPPRAGISAFRAQRTRVTRRRRKLDGGAKLEALLLAGRARNGPIAHVDPERDRLPSLGLLQPQHQLWRRGQRGESPSGLGAILIPGTPSGATVGGSVMNSCFNGTETGEWTASDITALDFLY